MKLRRVLGDERGSVAVAGILLTVALTLLLGAGIDVARAFVLRAELNAIADDAALAGGDQIDLAAWRAGRLVLDPAAARNAAEAELGANPEVAGAVSAGAASVRVAVTARFSTVALRFVGIPQLEVESVVQAAPETP